MKSSITIDRAFMTARINALATKKIFWSEVDFQLALAWEIKQTLPEADICLERRYMNDSGEPMYIDVCVTYQGRLYPIELKYKTKQVEIPDADNQLISLKAHGACDLGRYGFLKDIARIENLSKKENFERGFAIILTNDPLYYTANQRKSVDIEFKIHEGKTVGPGHWPGGRKPTGPKNIRRLLCRELIPVTGFPTIIRMTSRELSKCLYVKLNRKTDASKVMQEGITRLLPAEVLHGDMCLSIYQIINN